SKQMASVIGWISGILTLLVLFSYPADFASDDHRLLIAIATLTAFMVNVGLPFSAGEINSAHTVGIMAYLLLASPANALWIVVIGALVGVIIRDARRHYGKTWQDFFGTVWE